MTQAEAHIAVRTTLVALAQLAAKTRTPVDDMMLQILEANREKLSAAVCDLSNDESQPPSVERIIAALAAKGIRA